MDHNVNLWDSTAEIHDSNPSEQNRTNSRWGIGAAFTKLVGQTIPGRNGTSSQPNSSHGAAKLQKPYGTDNDMEMDQSAGSFWNKLQDGGLEDDDEATTASSRNLLGAGDYESDYEADDTGPWKRSQASSQIKSKNATLLSAEPDLDEEPELLPRQSIAKTRNKKAEKLKPDYQQPANYHSKRPFGHNRDMDEEDDSHEDSSDNDASDEESMDESDLENRRDGNESDRSQGGLGAFLNMKKEAALEENLKAFMNPDPDDKSIADMSLISASITPAEQRRLLLKRMDMSLDKSVSTALNPAEAATKELRPWRQQKDLRRGSNLGALPHGTMTMLQSLYKENDDESEEEEEDLLYSIPAEFESSLDRHIPKGKNFDDMWKDGAATVCSSDMIPTFAGDDDTVVDDYSQNLIAQKVKDKLDAEDRTSLFPEMDDEINTIAQQKARDQLAALTPSSEPSFAYNSEPLSSRRTSHASKSSGSGESSERQQRRRRRNEADGRKSSRRTRAATEDKSNRLRDKSDGRRRRRSTLPRSDGHATREKTNGDHEEFLNDLSIQDTSTSSRRARTTVRRGEKKDDNHNDRGDDRNKDRSKRGTSRRHESELRERKSSSTHKDAKVMEDTSSRRRERSHRRRSPTHRSHREGGSDRNSKEVEAKRRTKSSRPDRNDEFDKDNVGDEGRRSTNKSKNNGHREEDESRRHRDKASSRPKENTERRKQQSTARNDEKDVRDSRRRRNDSDGDIHAQSKSGVSSTKTSPKNNDILKDLKPVIGMKSRRSSQESLGSATAKHENTAFIREVRRSNDEKNAEDPKASSVMPRKKLEGTSSTGTRSTLESTASLGFEDNDVLESSGKSRVKGFFASLVLSKKNQHSRMDDDDDNAMTSDPIKVPRRRFSGGETTKPGAGVLAAALRKSSLEQKSKNTSRSDAVETLSLLSEELKTSTQNGWGSIVNEEEEVTNDDNAKTSKHLSRHSTKKSTEEQQQTFTKKKYDKEEKEEKSPKGTATMHDNSKTSSRRPRRSTSVPPDQELPSSSRSKKSSSAMRDEERRRRTYSVPKGATTKTTTTTTKTGKSSQTRTTKRPTSRTHTVSSSSEEKRHNGKVESTTVRTSSKTPRSEETTTTTNKSHATKTKRK